MAESIEQKTELKQVEIDNAETIAKLKKQKAVVKTAFTKAKTTFWNLMICHLVGQLGMLWTQYPLLKQKQYVSW